ncbi:glycerophosphodiester phosphodiesterase [Gordonia sp. ABSL11-1]|uniref:glycerophosphodiester phosphodiesterase n=1 Tax=Gordonia sp. ABSL11-1 TaxID=3053924 RepID=UPI00257321DF|nr:glycerophosphodiester phosphodiesterase family protein [Gordonia sp. ABSL11-1]MDL9945536.1 glycerophosphodiester phosphodiesterase [Gordonia sp. ABSL11-1]
MTDSSAPVAIVRGGHSTALKWHRARRRAGDPAFTARRIVEGMRAGAAVEIDLVIHADRGFAVLHDRDVAHGTTGRGHISQLSADQVRSLLLRADDGTPLDDPVLLVEDLAEILSDVDVHPDALLQLDFKETAADLDERAVTTFADAVAPFARSAILSCGDAAAVALLTDPVRDIRIGFDPCHGGAVDRVLRSGRFDEFADAAVAASPRAEMVYLERRLVLDADRRGHDLIAAFHDRGRTVDAYTVYAADDASVRDVLRLVELRVDQITTDDAEGLLAAIGSPID